jgi:antitoxin (DNA-binding transcriptional repressor) of toxin-antitoxin stability system
MGVATKMAKQANINEVKTYLSRYLAELKPGESVMICNHNHPVAELRAVSQPSSKPPKLGVAKGEFQLSDSFFEPLPEDILKAFQGE